MDVSAMLVAIIHLRVPSGGDEKMLNCCAGESAAYKGKVCTLCALAKKGGPHVRSDLRVEHSLVIAGRTS
jgi:hypothetical protein